MADTSKCFSLVRGRVLRVTRLDACGATVPGPTSQVVSEGFISVALTANIDEGTAINVTNAAGKVCILDEPCPVFTGYDVAIELCGVDPDLIAVMTGQEIVTDDGDLGVGFRVNSAVDVCDSGFALEIWSNVPAGACEPGAGQNFGYFLIPFLKGGTIGDFTIANDAVNFTLSGAKSKDGSAWGVGPYNVVGTPAGPLLTAIDDHDHLHMQLTTVPPPEDTECGAAALGVAATGATAGTPADLTPPNSWPPEDLADAASGFIATPTTAWTAGQYVVLGDGSTAHWSGTAWVAGVA